MTGLFNKKEKEFPHVINIVTENGAKYIWPFKFLPHQDEIIRLSRFSIQFEAKLEGEYKVLQIIYLYDHESNYRGENTIFIHIKKIAERKCESCGRKIKDYDCLTKCHDCAMKQWKAEEAAKQIVENKQILEELKEIKID